MMVCSTLTVLLALSSAVLMVYFARSGGGTGVLGGKSVGMTAVSVGGAAVGRANVAVGVASGVGEVHAKRGIAISIRSNFCILLCSRRRPRRRIL